MELPPTFTAIWIVLLLSMLAISYRRGKKALSIFPPLQSVQVLFKEKGVSGSSRKSLKTRLGGATKTLEIIITPEELWIRSPLIWAGLGNQSDLTHKVSLNQITAVDYSAKQVVISFTDAKHSITTLDLLIKKAPEFVETLQAHRSQPRG